MGGWTDRQTDRQKERSTDRWMDGKMDRAKNRWTTMKYTKNPIDQRKDQLINDF